MARQQGKDPGRFGRIWSVFDEVFGSPPVWAAGLVRPYPSVNIYERPDSFQVRVEVAGAARDDLELTVEDATLVISGHEKEPDVEGLVCHCRERAAGSFRRSITLPEGADTSAEPQASLRDGVLTVTFPKRGRPEPRSVEVSEG